MRAKPLQRIATATHRVRARPLACWSCRLHLARSRRCLGTAAAAAAETPHAASSTDQLAMQHVLLQLRQTLGIDAMRGKEVGCDTQCKAWPLSLPEAVSKAACTLNRPLPQARASILASTSRGACGGVLMAPSLRKFAVKSLASNGAMMEVQTAVAGRCVLGWGDVCWL